MQRATKDTKGGSVIVFDLECDNSHRFEGWFASSEDFERQNQEGGIACPLCGNADVIRVPNAPHIKKSPDRTAVRVADQEMQYSNIAGELLNHLVDYVVRNTEDVGAAFAEEARKIHYREVPERKIRGTASSDEVVELKDEGIDVVALPIPRERLEKPH
jgi:hypothetical protein